MSTNLYNYYDKIKEFFAVGYMSTNLYNYTINGTKPPARTAAPSVMANVEFPVGILYIQLW
jgi:hypothetical protein